MPLQYIFWLLMILVFFGFIFTTPLTIYSGGIGAVVFALFFILGWQVFGFVVQGK
jgi:hypothetical protein